MKTFNRYMGFMLLLVLTVLSTSSTSAAVEVEAPPIIIDEVESIITPPTPLETLPFSIEYLGDFTLTAYCPCEICCGKWAHNRPKAGGKDIVFTHSGAVAQEGITIAVDPKIIPFGTALYIEGFGIRIAQDSGSAVKNNVIDIYMETHSKANFKLSEVRVWVIEEAELNETVFPDESQGVR